MRVIAGTHRGRRLAAPRGQDTRPTSDRVREALFSILGPLDGERVLDLFAGSALLCDASRAAVEIIQANLAALGLEAQVVQDEFARVLRNATARGAAYDLIFLDPPYRQAEHWAADLSQLVPPVLAPGGRVVVESDRRTPLQLDLPLLAERRYGDTLIRLHTHEH